MGYRIKGWNKFQHFKDRRPPWIKLYRDILDDIEWHELDSVAAKSLVMLWLIASENDGSLPDTKILAFRLRVTESQIKSTISKLSHWVEQDDINPISERYQDDPLEREEEVETDIRDREEKKVRVARAFPRPDDVDQAVWDDWVQLRKNKRATVSQTVVDGARLEANKAGMTLNAFLREWVMRGSQGLKAEWLVGKAPQKTEHQKRQDATTRAIFGENPFLSTIKTIEGEVIRDTENFTRQLGR